MAAFQRFSEYALLDLQRLVNQNLHRSGNMSGHAMRRTIADEDAPTTSAHPFRVSVGAADSCSVASGCAYGYYMRALAAGITFTLTDHSNTCVFIYCAVSYSEVDRRIYAEIIPSDVQLAVFDRQPGGYPTYHYEIAQVSRAAVGDPWLIYQRLHCDIITPITAHHLPVIGNSLKPLLRLREGEGDEWIFELADTGVRAPAPNRVLATDGDTELYWKECPCDESKSESESESKSESASSGSSGSSQCPLSSSGSSSESYSWPSSWAQSWSESGSGSSGYPSGSGAVLRDKWYVYDIYDVYDGIEYWVDGGVQSGSWFQDDPACVPGRHPYYDYWPIFDDEGEWIDDEIVDTGNYQEIRLLAGPFDTETEARNWRDEHVHH